MIAENAIDWTIPWKEKVREEGKDLRRETLLIAAQLGYGGTPA